MLEIKNKHPRDKRITFIEQGHKYIVNDAEDFSSVTTFIHKFFKDFNEEEIIDKNYDKWQTDSSNKYFGKSKKDIKQFWNDNRNKSSTFGTKTHLAIELFLNQKLDTLNELSDNVSFQYFLKFMEDYNNYDIYRTEWCVYHEELKLAGSIDAVFKDGDNLVIVDWKTNKAIRHDNTFTKGLYPLQHVDDCNYMHYSLQLSVYKFILESKYGIKINNLQLVWLNKTNKSYEVIDCSYMSEELSKMFGERINELYKN